MKHKHLLLLLFLPLLLVGCHPDDDVDLPEPEPQKPVSELILGQWYTSPSNTYSRYDITENGITIYTDPTGHNQGGASYTLKESGGKTYIELEDITYNYEIYEITSISDSTMTWEVTDSLAQLWFDNPWYNSPGTHELHFKKRVKHPLEDKITGFWDTETTTKVTYDADGNIVKQESAPNDPKGFEFWVDWCSVFFPNGAYANGDWSLKDQGEKTYLTYSHDDDPTPVTNEVVSVTEDKMVWKRTESPTVAYIIELSR